MSGNPVAVSFVLPVHRGVRWLDEVLRAIFDQRGLADLEVIAIDDGGEDGSREILDAWARRGSVRVLAGRQVGAAAAINDGVRASRHALIGQVDQDVIVTPNWAELLAAELEAGEQVAAAQGLYRTDAADGLWARAMGLDLALRYRRIAGRYVDHVCTGNSVYRKQALLAVGLFDESLGYGYDNDMSYRLQRAGYRLAFCREAQAVHHWRTGARGYLRQQYGAGYGRLDLIAKHPDRVAGDQVSGPGMMAHAALTLLGLAALLLGAAAGPSGGPWAPLVLLGTGLLGLLSLERLMTGVTARRAFSDPAGLFFPLAHLARDLAWCAAILAWSARRLGRRPRRASHSMSR